MEFIFYNEVILYLLILILLLIIIAVIRKLSRKKNVINHWNILIKGLEYSPKEFYTQLEALIQSEGIEGLSFSDKKIRQGSIVSRKRLYRVLKWKEYSYIICASPFAHSFFMSYRVTVKHPFMVGLFLRIPFLGKYLVKWFFPLTFYKEDSINMFHSLVHQSIVDVINTIADGKGLERLSEEKTTIDTTNIFKR